MRNCTCLGSCRGADGLAPGWRCALGRSPMTTADLAATVDRMERHAIAVRLAELGRQLGEL